MKKLNKSIVLALLLASFSQVTFAEETAPATSTMTMGTSAVSTAETEEGALPGCKEDVAKFCANIEKGRGRIAKCLAEHKSELSSSCQAKKLEVRERLKDSRKSCAQDVKTFCGTQVGVPKINACLKANAAKVSEACKQSPFFTKGS
jgi:hypothetical protein